ncbi:unnamed protein product [Effrenium voratum]|nr:unnamed protein product [Effrenium voratum]
MPCDRLWQRDLLATELEDVLEGRLEHWRNQPREAAQLWRALAQQNPRRALAVLEFCTARGVQAPDVISFNMAIRAAQGQWQCALEFLHQLKSNLVQSSQVTLNTVITALERGRWQRSLLHVAESRTSSLGPDTVTWNSLASAAARATRWPQSLAFAFQDADIFGFNTALSALQKASMWASTQGLLSTMRSAGVEPDGFSTSTGLAALPAGSWRLALRWTEAASDVVAQSAAIAACEARWDVALQVFGEMRGARLDLVAHNSAIAASGRQRWQAPLEMLRDLEDAALQADIYSFGAVIASVADAGCWQLALWLLARTGPSTICLNAAVSACEKAGQWQWALELVSSKASLRDTTTFNAAVSSCGRGSNWQMALELLRVMKQEHLQQDVISYHAAIAACDRGGRWQEALAVLAVMFLSGLVPGIIGYNAAISACAQSARWQHAVALMSLASENAAVDVVTWNTVIAACPEHRVLPLLEEMIGSQIRVDLITYNSAINACGHWETALALLQQMISQDFQPDIFTCNSMLKIAAKGHWPAVLALFQQMKLAGVDETAVTDEIMLSALQGHLAFLQPCGALAQPVELARSS